MAINTNTSAPTLGVDAIHSLLTILLAAGWVCTRWTNGASDSGVVSVTTNPYSTSADLNATNAWFRVTAPSSTREWVFQRLTDAQTWNIQRGKTGFTTGGSATALATDSTSVSLASSSAASFSNPPGRCLIACDTATYAWSLSCITIGGGNVKSFIFDELLATGSYPTTPVADADPYLCGAYYNSTGMVATAGMQVRTDTGVTCYKRFRHNLTSPNNIRVSYPVLYDLSIGQVAPSTGTSNQVGAEPFNTQEAPVLISVCKPGAAAAGVGWVGFTSGQRWSTVAGRSNGQTLFDGTSTYWLYLAGLWTPWDSSSPTI